jgi:hypothetical protein
MSPNHSKGPLVFSVIAAAAIGCAPPAPDTPGQPELAPGETSTTVKVFSAEIGDDQIMAGGTRDVVATIHQMATAGSPKPDYQPPVVFPKIDPRLLAAVTRAEAAETLAQPVEVLVRFVEDTTLPEAAAVAEL